jgi:hypothetical protein
VIPIAQTNTPSNAQGFSQALVTVTSVDSNQTAICTDRYQRYYPPISILNIAGSGSLPQAGDVWLVDRSNGGWTFKTRVAPNLPVITGSTSGDTGAVVSALLTALDSLGVIINSTTP